MTGHALVIGQKDEPPAVRRWVGKPIIGLISSDLFLLRAVGFHSPDLHGSGALGIEIDPVAIRGVIRSIIEALGVGQAFLLTPFGRDRIDIEFAFSLGAVREQGIIRRPAMPIARTGCSDLPRRAT